MNTGSRLTRADVEKFLDEHGARMQEYTVGIAQAGMEFVEFMEAGGENFVDRAAALKYSGRLAAFSVSSLAIPLLWLKVIESVHDGPKQEDVG